MTDIIKDAFKESLEKAFAEIAEKATGKTE